MANLEQLEQGAANATGDQIEVAGLFEPKGLKGKQITGIVAGSVIGDAIGGNVGDDIGTILGGAVGTAAGSDQGQLRFVVALSTTKVYVLRPTSWDSLHKEEQQVIATFDRATVHVTVRGRVSVRTLVLEDPDSGQSIELEGMRVWYAHSKPVIEGLLANNFEEKETALEAST